jgi:hypothetical protein
MRIERGLELGTVARAKSSTWGWAGRTVAGAAGTIGANPARAGASVSKLIARS